MYGRRVRNACMPAALRIVYASWHSLLLARRHPDLWWPLWPFHCDEPFQPQVCDACMHARVYTHTHTHAAAPLTLRTTTTKPTSTVHMHPCMHICTHSCMEGGSGAKLVRVLRNIEEDHEICIDYTGGAVAHLTRQERCQRLLEFGFKCECSTCLEGGERSDENRQDLERCFFFFGGGGMVVLQRNFAHRS